MQIFWNNSLRRENSDKFLKNDRSYREIYYSLNHNGAIPKKSFYISLVAGWTQSTTASLFSSFYLKVSGHPPTGPHQTLQPCLQILFRGRKKDPILHREVVHAFFPPFFKHYLRHNRNKISRESQMEQNSPQHIPGYAFWIIYPQQSLWSRLGVYCMSLSMTVVKQYSKFGFHSSSLTLGCFAL